MKPFLGDMNNNSKKQLADAVSKALLQGKYVTKDSNDGHYERLGYIVTNDNNITGREPIMITVINNGVEVTWMHEDALDLDNEGMVNFLKGAIYVIDSSLKPQDVDDKTLVFEYTDHENPQK